jgi:hypothetical protein
VSEVDADRLDRIAAILALANRGAIAEAKREIREDRLNVAILDACSSEWAPAGEIWDKVAKKSKASRSTFKRRIAELVTEGALFRQGNAPAITYRASGLV